MTMSDEEFIDSLEGELEEERNCIESIKIQIAEKGVWEAKAKAAVRHKNRNVQSLVKEIADLKAQARLNKFRGCKHDDE